MKKILIVCILCLLAFKQNSLAQNYKTGFGVRAGGYQNALSIKHFFRPSVAVEGLIGNGYFRRGVSLTVLIEKSVTAFDREEFQFFYGAGAHIGAYRGKYFYRDFNNKNYRYYDDEFLALGLDGIIGLEWKIPEIPLSLGVDVRPIIELAQPGLSTIDPGFTIRFTL